LFSLSGGDDAHVLRLVLLSLLVLGLRPEAGLCNEVAGVPGLGHGLGQGRGLWLPLGGRPTFGETGDPVRELTTLMIGIAHGSCCRALDKAAHPEPEHDD